MHYLTILFNMFVFLLFSSDFSTTLNPYFVIVTQHKNIVTETPQHQQRNRPRCFGGDRIGKDILEVNWKRIEWKMLRKFYNFLLFEGSEIEAYGAEVTWLLSGERIWGVKGPLCRRMGFKLVGTGTLTTRLVCAEDRFHTLSKLERNLLKKLLLAI